MKKLFAVLALVLPAALLVAAFAADPLTRANWPTAVGFAPQLEQAGYAPGMTIDKSNLDQFKHLVPPAVATMVAKYGMSLPTKAYEPFSPSDGFITATNKHRGKAKLVPIGDATKERELVGHEGGMPFPAPENGRQIAWNYTLAYVGDDGESEFKVFWISAKRGVERTETWKTIGIRRAKFRTDVPPIPEVPELVSQDVIAATLTSALEPMDKRGFASLYFGYLEPREPEGWIYLPPQRRSIRLTFGTRGESWNSTDLLYEDVRGYTGSPEWMEWKLVKKTTMLGAMHSQVAQGKGGEKQVYDFDNPPHWNPRLTWELRPTYVVEVTPKLKSYPYSKMIFTIDAESSYILTKEAYDRKGQIWKVLINAVSASPDPTRQPPLIAASLVVDTQANHATAFYWHDQKQNIGVKPSLFKLSTLRKLGR
jgi:Protein of unknown function (DUF1329)